MLMVIALLGLAGSLLVILAYRSAEAVIVAPMQYSQILWASVYGYFIFGEQIDGPTALGAAIVIGSGIYIVLREGRSGASANRPVLETRGRTETATTPRSSILQRLVRPVLRG
jgi:S-adenosylmethionine uptake transporter